MPFSPRRPSPCHATPMPCFKISPTPLGLGLVSLILLVSIPGMYQQTAGDVVRIEICQPNRRLPSYMQEACNELLASRGTPESAMADSGTGASPPDRRPLSDPPRYGRSDGGSSLSVLLTKRLSSQPRFKLDNATDRKKSSGHKSQGHRAYLRRSLSLLRQLGASLNDQFHLFEDI